MALCGECKKFLNPNHILEKTNYKRTRVCKKGKEVDSLTLSCNSYIPNLTSAIEKHIDNSKKLSEVLSKSQSRPKLIKRKIKKSTKQLTLFSSGKNTL